MVELVAVQSAQAIPPPTGPRDERELVQLARRGDRSAAGELVELTYGSVFASLYRMCGDSDLASDLTQDTYRKAWEAFSEFDGRSKLFTWLYRIAWTTFLNHVRRPARVVSIEDAGRQEFRDPAIGADEVAATNEASERLRLAVLKLPDDLRFTVTAHYWGELSVKEIAEAEGITTVAIRKRLDKAYTLLQPLIEGTE